MVVKSAFFNLLRLLKLNYRLETRNSRIILVIVFHQVNDNQDKIYKAVPIKVFDQLCRFFSRYTNPINFSNLLCDELVKDKLNVIFSFDDGHYDLIENILPITKKYGIPINVNIDTEPLLTGLPQDNIRVYNVLNSTEKLFYRNLKYFNDSVELGKNVKTEIIFSKKLRTLNKNERRLFSNDILQQLGNNKTKFSRICSKKEVALLEREGAEIGSHTHTHPMLINENFEVIKWELKKSKEILEEVINKRIDIIAYPNGLGNLEIDRISKEVGYKFILNTEGNANTFNKVKNGIINRRNVYQQTSSEALSQIFGVNDKLKTVMNLIKQ